MTTEEIRVILAAVAAERGGPPHRVRSDNGPEFVAEVVRSWLEGSGSGSWPVGPASPWQNGYAESFHSKLRDEFLDREEFESEPQARSLGRLWKGEYDTERPHRSLGFRTPAEFAATCARFVPIEEEPTAQIVQPHFCIIPARRQAGQPGPIVRYLRPVSLSSLTSINTALTRRRADASFGNSPATLVRRLISSLSRSNSSTVTDSP